MIRPFHSNCSTGDANAFLKMAIYSKENCPKLIQNFAKDFNFCKIWSQPKLLPCPREWFSRCRSPPLPRPTKSSQLSTKFKSNKTSQDHNYLVLYLFVSISRHILPLFLISLSLTFIRVPVPLPFPYIIQISAHITFFIETSRFENVLCPFINSVDWNSLFLFHHY